ncbi:MAG: efflux RND transporter periplasmic adaptor subunit [Candidatus Eisenbacteria bacterium]|uniref:Efflux RND transporter periplasmic adaptor subunit n=1 Tax=Eiseniibacteriota bacterium TaxID=2212470 RepID=A0A9D6QP45_UNCEI|nr:efflux RND transporter periplasmic adaptor subunit [Candidatus Eisenbacteria bacterium]MBI3539574.1 efflux RND transporter periplasmic adaptor subunit [Candidatus Eisenbacteria bacterium]
MKKKWLWIALAGVLVIVLVVANIARTSGGKVEGVQLARLRVEDVTSRVKAPGKIEPKTQVKISADVPGKIIRLAVAEGDRVRTGQLLLQLDDTQYRAIFNQSKANLAAAQARLKDARATLKVDEDNYVRQRSLFEQKLLSQAEWDRAAATIETARSAAASAQEDVTRSEAMLAASNDNLNKTHFVAPFDGVVSALDVEQGEIVMTGTMNNPGTQIMVVSDLSRMQVRADVDEADVVDIRIGQKARIKVDALPDTLFDGTVTEIGNTAKRTITAGSEGQTNFEVHVVFDHTVPAVRPGMTADVEVQTGTHAKAKAVPIQAVVVRTERELQKAMRKTAGRSKPRPGDAAADEDTVGKKDKEVTGVFVEKNGVVTFVPVKAGIASESMIEVTGDVKEGDMVVSGPYKALRELKPGAKVKREEAAGVRKKG